MKTFILTVSALLALSAYAATSYTHDENHDPQEVKQEEIERRDIHKPGQVSESNASEQTEEEQDVKDADPQYDPIDDDLEEDEGSFQE